MILNFNDFTDQICVLPTLPFGSFDGNKDLVIPGEAITFACHQHYIIQKISSFETQLHCNKSGMLSTLPICTRGTIYYRISLKARYSIFQCKCNEQMFPHEPWKKILAQIHLVSDPSSAEERKNRIVPTHSNFDKWRNWAEG